MKKAIAGVLLVGALAGAATADAQTDVLKQKKCTADGWHGESKARAPKGTTCATAHNVLAKWMRDDGLEGTTRLRVGSDGVLWKCYGIRASGRLNPYYVSCHSSQRNYHYSERYGSSFTTKWFEFEYRTNEAANSEEDE